MAVLGQGVADGVLSRHPAIEYATRETTDPVAQLNRRILEGAISLKSDGRQGHLRSVLDALKVPIESQTLVYSQTSLQSPLITRAHPRALYFNDTTAVGWVPGSDALEVAALDARQGTVFYLLSQTQGPRPQFSRSQRCLQCHETRMTELVPGMLTMSMLPMTDDPNEYATGWQVDHSTPIEDRWGGWFVTGPAVPVRHLGNVPVYHAEKSGTRAVVAPKLASVTDVIEPSAYLTPYSDVAALIVLNHQTAMTNLLTRLSWMTRVVDYAREVGRATDSDAISDSVAAEVERLVDYMLFVDEAPLPGRIRGNSGFAEGFAANGPKDSRGRSLRDLDLSTRLLKYPCSYMIYSPAFDALSSWAKAAVYTRLWEVLSGQVTDTVYQRLTLEDRQAIVEILKDTKPDLPATFR